MKFSIKNFFGKCDQICKKLYWSSLLKRSLMENFVFCAVDVVKSIKNLKEALDVTYEIIKLVEKSPSRESKTVKTKEEAKKKVF